jgi:hypothetical protein
MTLIEFRLLELKNEMVNLEFSEYHFFDDVLSDMKLTPADIEIPVPRYFTQVSALHRIIDMIIVPNK